MTCSLMFGCESRISGFSGGVIVPDGAVSSSCGFCVLRERKVSDFWLCSPGVM
jgi:hypothetical protein